MASSDLFVNSSNKRPKRGLKAKHERKRKEAEARQEKYAKLPFSQKLEKAGAKEKAKLLAKQKEGKSL
jgi:hypothetical protein